MDSIITVGDYPEPNFTFSPQNPTNFFPEVSFTDVTEDNSESWHWDFGDPDSDDNESGEQHPVHRFSTSGDFPVTLKVSSELGCTETIMFTVHVGSEFTFYAPNAFSPNSDDRNDYFRTYADGINEDTYECYIYDRWGEEIYIMTKLEDGWDGTKQGFDERCPVGVYSWVASFKDLSGTLQKYVGVVTLLD
jgi:gliding motility-associated-like protein